MILRIFLIFGDLSLDDSYKLNSYKKKCVPTQNDHCRYLTKIIGYENEWIISRLLDCDPVFSLMRDVEE